MKARSLYAIFDYRKDRSACMFYLYFQRNQALKNGSIFRKRNRA